MVAKGKLTRQQQAVYDYIRDMILARGYGPTVREIGEHMSIKSPNGVMCHLRALERKGVITRGANKSRAIELVEPLSKLIRVPLKIEGIIRQGTSQTDPDSDDEFNLGELVDETDQLGDRFGLRVTDDSLIEAQIRRGDLLVIRKQTHVRNNQLVLIELMGEVRVGHWTQEGENAFLQPVALSHPQLPIPAESRIVGLIVGVVRDLTIGQNSASL